MKEAKVEVVPPEIPGLEENLCVCCNFSLSFFCNCYTSHRIGKRIINKRHPKFQLLLFLIKATCLSTWCESN